MHTALSLDPGVTTGFVIGRIDELRTEVSVNQRKYVHQQLYNCIQTINPETIVCEGFEHRQGMRANPNLYPVELIGVVRLFSQKYQIPLVVQSARAGKEYFTDKKLRDMELYVRGRPHGMDALRHFLQWLHFGQGFQYFKEQEILLVP